jgi:hypothetical protein
MRLLLYEKGVVGLSSSLSQASPKQKRGGPKEIDDGAAKSRARTAQKNKERDATKRLVLKANVCAAYAHVETAEVARPQSLEELTQNFMQVALRGYPALGERAPPVLTALFGHIADRATDPSTSPALGLQKNINADNQQ